MSAASVLEISDLAVELDTRRGPVRAIDGISLTVGTGERLGLVGESGSGKSMTLRAVMGLLPGTARVCSGSIRLDGHDVTDRVLGGGRRASVAVAGTVSMVFQEPQTALNPLMRVGAQIVDGVRRRENLTRPAARSLAIELMTRVGIADPAARVDAYPFELSGGMRSA